MSLNNEVTPMAVKKEAPKKAAAKAAPQEGRPQEGRPQEEVSEAKIGRVSDAGESILPVGSSQYVFEGYPWQ